MIHYANLTSVESVRLAFEYGKTVEFLTDEGWVRLSVPNTDAEVAVNLSRGRLYRAVENRPGDE